MLNRLYLRIHFSPNRTAGTTAMDSDGYDSQPDADERSTVTDESDPSSDGESKYSSSASFVCDSDAEGDGDTVHHTPGNTVGGGCLTAQHFSVDIWRRILTAAAASDRLRRLLSSLGSSSRACRDLLLQQLPFSLSVSEHELIECRAVFPNVASLRVRGGVVWSNLCGIPCLRLVGGGGGVSPATPANPLVDVTSLTLRDWEGDLEFLRCMPRLEKLRIRGLQSSPSMLPVASLKSLQYLRCEKMLAQDVCALGDVELPSECILKVKSLKPVSETCGFHTWGAPATVLRDLSCRLHFSASSWKGWNP
jgi:hypothetical protein